MGRIEVISRTKGLKGVSTDELSIGENTSELIKLISEANKNISIDRLRVTIKDAGAKVANQQIPLDPKLPIAETAGIPDDAASITLYVKDLGPQIAWRTVFLVEYLGPLLIHPFFYHFTSIYSTATGVHTQTQVLAYYLVLLHYIKREYETLFVHKFSSATMPVFNIFKNSSHYWILSGFNLAFFIYAPNFTESSNAFTKFLFHVNDFPSYINYALVGLWAFAELSNFKCHLITSGLRKKDGEGHVIPYGYGFNLVSFPNYFFETLGWFTIAVLTGNWTSWLFLAVSGGQMLIWAIKKHKKYLKTFGDDYKKLKRTAMIPYVI